MTIRLLALDIDGTLAWRGDEVLPATRAALHRAEERGLHVVIATGRRYRTTCRVIDALGLDVPAVVLGGALVKSGARETVHRAAIPADDLAHVLASFRAHGQSAAGQRDHAEGGADFVVDGALAWNGWMSRYVEQNQDHVEWHRDLAAEQRDDILVLGTFGPRDEVEAVARDVETRHPGRFTTVVTPMPRDTAGGHYLEVGGADVCKWRGLERLARHLDIPPEAICAVGDERNDLSMVQGARIGVAMGNGSPELQAVADWVAGRHDEDGLVEVVDRLLDELEGR